MLKIYLSLRGGFVAIEFILYEVIHEMEIVQGQLMETIRDMTIPQKVIKLFYIVFDGTTLHSLYLDKYVYLKTRAMLRKHRAKKERRLVILQREVEVRELALNA